MSDHDFNQHKLRRLIETSCLNGGSGELEAKKFTVEAASSPEASNFSFRLLLSTSLLHTILKTNTLCGYVVGIPKIQL